MDKATGKLQVQVCFAKPDSVLLRDVLVPPGSTLQAAIEHSGILSEMPEIDLSACQVGIYAKLKTLETILRDGDRIEIYRPLIADPKESRRRRADRKSGLSSDS
ncbi:RnfH family protein [Herminiimonas sp. CN]|uniref:RnfH family protein n=1 Tax=Herminiimonas sp. CN TaxID=1349818 RepID=UPI0004741A26|nr:RnfH family protein [Herminiimonas sp. CN]